MGESIRLTYFNVKALAEPIRLILAVAGVDYEDKRIEREEWPALKEQYPWGQLPLLEIGDQKLAQSNAIARFLAKKYNLAGKDDFESAKIDEIVDAMADLRHDWKKYFMEKDEKKKGEYKKDLIENRVPFYFSKLDSLHEQNGSNYLVGDRLSWADILVAHYLEFFESAGDPNILVPYPNLKKLKDTVYGLPEVKAWVEKRPKTAM